MDFFAVVKEMATKKKVPGTFGHFVHRIPDVNKAYNWWLGAQNKYWLHFKHDLDSLWLLIMT